MSRMRSKNQSGGNEARAAFRFSDDTATCGDAGFDGQLKNQQQAQTRNQAEEEEALKLARELLDAEKGNAEVQCALAYPYLTGDSLCSYGVPVDKKQAYYWFKKAADQGDETAKYEPEHWN